MTEPTDKEQYLNIADQCAATATSDLAASILVDGGNGTLRQLLNDAADAIRAGWATPQPTQAQAGAVPLNWPTNEMIEAGRKAAISHGPLLGGGQSLWHVFRDMLAASPTPPAQAADSVLEDTARESEYRRGYRHGYEQRDAEVRGALA